MPPEAFTPVPLLNMKPSHLVPIAIIAATLLPAMAQAKPRHDNFVNAKSAGRTSAFDLTASLAGATRESGEAGNSGTIWIRWKSPSTGIAVFSATARNAQSAYAPILRLGQGAKAREMRYAAISRDVNGRASLRVPVLKDQTYQIQVEDANSWSAGLSVRVSLNRIDPITQSDFGLQRNVPVYFPRPKANDNFASAHLLADRKGKKWVYPSRFAAIASNLESTVESGEPHDHRHGTVWFRWVAPATGMATFEATERDTNHDRVTPIIRVGQGTAVRQFRVAGQSRDVNGAARLQIPVAKGQTYQIQLENNSWRRGQTVSLNLTGITPNRNADFSIQNGVPYFYTAPASGNDNYAKASVMASRDKAGKMVYPPRFSATASGYGATVESGEPADGSWGTVWFRWKAPVTGIATFESSVRNKDHARLTPVMRIVQGKGVRSVRVAAMSRDVEGVAHIIVPVLKGQEYGIQVEHPWGGAQTVTLNLAGIEANHLREFGIQQGAPYFYVPPHRNDNFAQATRLATRDSKGKEVFPSRFSAVASTRDTSMESGEPQWYSRFGSVWFAWRAPETGVATFEALSRDRDHAQRQPTLRVGQGSPAQEADWRVGNFRIAAASFDSNGLARTVVPVQKGQLYYLQIENPWGGSQTSTLNLIGITRNDLADMGILGGVPYFCIRPGANDMFSQAASLGSVDRFSATASLYDATPEAGEEVGRGASGSVWFRWVAPRSGTAVFETIGRTTNYESFTPNLRIGQGDSVSGLRYAVPVEESEVVGSLRRLKVAVQAGQTYRIQVEEGWTDGQTITLNLARWE